MDDSLTMQDGLTSELTDCRRERALPANAASEESGASKLQRLAAVRCSDLVRLSSGLPYPAKANVL